MSLLQWILRFLRKICTTSPVRWTIRSILALYSFLNGKAAKSPPVKGASDSPVKNEIHYPGPLLPEEKTITAPTTSAIICASRFPDANTLHPYVFSVPSASSSLQDVRPSSIHSDVNLPRSSGQLRRISLSNWSGDLGIGNRNRSNPRIDPPTVSGHHDRSSRPNSYHAGSRPHSFHTSSRPPSFHGQLSVSRLTIGSQTSVPSITVEQGPSEEGFEAAPIRASPVQEEHPFTFPLGGNQQLRQAYEKFEPITPESHPRYDREDYALDEDTDFELKPQTVFFQPDDIPAGWKRFLHPEGACYYAYQDKKYYTDANLLDGPTRSRIESCMNDFEEYCRGQSINLTPKMNTVFHLRANPDDPKKYTCMYYIADHETRSVFWLDVFTTSQLGTWGTIRGVRSLTHVGHAITMEYWYHCHLFPNSYSLTVDAVDELRDILSHSICDSITSSTSTVPYNITDLKDMMFLMENLRTNIETGGSVSAFSRIMCIFVQQRFINHHGQPAVRLDRDRSVYHPPEKTQNRPWLMRIISPALFSAPDLYYRLLRKLWVDGLVHEASWGEFVAKMNEEWQQLILFNTVLLNANVAFLAIQSVDNASASPGRSPAQIASFLSIIASFGSIIVGLVLARKHRAKARDTASEAASFLSSWDRNGLGLATLAILYSAPYAMLMWGVMCFLVAFSFMCYSNSDVLVRTIMSGAWFIIVILVLWCTTALASWDTRMYDEKSFWEAAHQVLSYVLFGVWMLIESAITQVSKGLLYFQSKKVQQTQQRPRELRNTRKSSVGTVVIELWRRSSLFVRAENDRRDTAETDRTAVEV